MAGLCAASLLTLALCACIAVKESGVSRTLTPGANPFHKRETGTGFCAGFVRTQRPRTRKQRRKVLAKSLAGYQTISMQLSLGFPPQRCCHLQRKAHLAHPRVLHSFRQSLQQCHTFSTKKTSTRPHRQARVTMRTAAAPDTAIGTQVGGYCSLFVTNNSKEGALASRYLQYKQEKLKGKFGAILCV